MEEDNNKKLLSNQNQIQTPQLSLTSQINSYVNSQMFVNSQKFVRKVTQTFVRKFTNILTQIQKCSYVNSETFLRKFTNVCRQIFIIFTHKTLF